jgi:hypothetical protein
MHALYERGIAGADELCGSPRPHVTGVTAVIVAVLVKRRHVAASPHDSVKSSRLAESASATSSHTPFVWLPAVMVVAALAGHLVIFRALAR